MISVEIPRYADLSLRHLVLDYNGTVAVDGTLVEALKERIVRLAERLEIHVVTADTFGTVQANFRGLPVSVKVLESDDHTQEKRRFVESLGAENCVAVGNGNNDAAMLEAAALGIAVVGEEGCALASLRAADLVCREPVDALDLLLSPKRLVATLRR